MSVSDKDGIAIALATEKNPQAVTMSFQKEYAERYDWLVKEFSDWAFTFTTSFSYYMDYDSLDEQTKNCIVRAYVCIWRNITPDLPYLISEKCPGYRMELPFPARHDPDVLFFMLTGSDCDMKLCKNCGRAFIASRKGEMSSAFRNAISIMSIRQGLRKIKQMNNE